MREHTRAHTRMQSGFFLPATENQPMIIEGEFKTFKLNETKQEEQSNKTSHGFLCCALQSKFSWHFYPAGVICNSNI